MKTWVRVTFAVMFVGLGALVVALSAETTDSRFCHLVGCAGEVSLEMALVDVDIAVADHSVVVCAFDIDGTEVGCSDADVPADALQLDRFSLELEDLDAERVAAVAVTISTSNLGDVVYGSVLPVTFTSYRPNGPDCPPLCWSARVVL